MRRLLAVLGEDVSRSLSPFLHARAAEECAIDVAYVPVSCATPDAFARAVGALRTLGALGCNVTSPYKEHALRLSDRLTATASEIGAVNTLRFSESGIEGENTDGPGLLRVLGGIPGDRLDRAQVLGAGGAARASLWAATRIGVGSLHVCARRGAGDLARGFLAKGGPLEPVAGATLVISTLPGRPDIAECVLREWIDASRSPFILDLAYGTHESPSPLVQLARAAGLPAIDGLSMLVEQAALSLAFWAGGEVSQIRAAMRRASGLAPGRAGRFDSQHGQD